MIDLALDPKSTDLLIENFDIQLVKDRIQISQNLAIRLRFILGEWFLDITAGVPYYEDIFIKGPNQYRVESVLKEEIVNTKGVSEILSFSSQFDSRNRDFSVEFACDTISGQVNLELELL